MPDDVNEPLIYRYEMFADYHQIYLEDSEHDSAWPTEDPERLQQIDAFTAQIINSESLARHLGVAPGVVCLLTARNMMSPLEVEIRQGPPEEDDAALDQIAEASLEVPSGCLLVSGCTDYLPDAPRIHLMPGVYRVRAYFGDVQALSEDGLDGDDHYRAVLWPAPYAEPATLRALNSGAW
jgi:hypothetical protein